MEESATAFSLTKNWLFFSLYFSCSISETVFFFLSAPLSLWSQCSISSEPVSLSGCKILPSFTLYHCLHFILLCFGSDGLSLHLRRFIVLSALFFPWSVSSDFSPYPIPVISTGGLSLLSGTMIHYRTVRYWFQASPFLATPPPEQASFCTVLRITFLLSIFLFYIIISPFSICIIHSRNMYFVLLTFVPFEESKRLKVSLNESEHLSCLSSSILVFSSLFPKQPGRLEQIQPRGASRVFRIKPNIYVGSWGSHDPVACCVSNFISCPTSHCCEVPATLGFFQFLKYTDAFLPLRLLLVFCTSAPWAYFSMVIPLHSLPQI